MQTGGVIPLQLNEVVPNQILHLQTGAIELEFPTKTKVVIEGPAFFQIENDSTLNLAKGCGNHYAPRYARNISISKHPLGKIVDLGTQFGVLVDHTNSEATVATKVFRW